MIERRRIMPVLPGDGSRRVHVDANAVIDYIRERTLHNMGMRPTSCRMEVLRERLEQIRHVYVAATAGAEAWKNLEKDIRRHLDRKDDTIVADRALALLGEYLDSVGIKDNLDHVPTAREMYATISKDPRNQKFSMWKIGKGVFRADPVLGSDANDLVILSTAASFAQQHAVELWTHDMDFTIFADEIRVTLGVEIVDTHRLGG